MTDDDTFITLFEAQQWPQERWDHRAHIRFAYLSLRDALFDAAARRVRDGIRAHNRANGTPEALDRGYHETVTLAWLRLVRIAMDAHDPGEFERFCEAHPHLLETGTLRRHYSRAHILSPEAKAEFVDPDLAPFDL